MLVGEIVPSLGDGLDADVGEQLHLERLSACKLLFLMDVPSVGKAEEILQIADYVPRAAPGHETYIEKRKTRGRE